MSAETTTAAALASIIGARVRRERLAKEWTLDRLADAAGISRRQVVNLEQGESNPSIGTLLKLSYALGMSLSELVEPPSVRQVQITRSGSGARLWESPRGGSGVLLASTAMPDVVELWEWRMTSGDRLESDAHPHGTRELLHVHAGTMTVQVGEEKHEVNAGDAIMFPGDVPHVYRNDADAPAHYSLSVFEPNPARTRGDSPQTSDQPSSERAPA